MSVRQINNLLSLLEFFAARKSPATLADVVNHFDWPRSSAFNILTTLCEAGYLYEPKTRSGYFPTPRWSQLVNAFAEADAIPEELTSILAPLSEETGETVCLSAPSGQFAVFINVVESSKAVRYATTAGKRVPIHVTASGQALLSCMSERDREVILRRAKYGCWGPNAAKDNDEVLRQLAEGRDRGWYRSASNFSPDLGGVSVPTVVDGRIFSITVAGPLFRVESKAKEHADLLQKLLFKI